jgi:hypothetical protein
VRLFDTHTFVLTFCRYKGNAGADKSTEEVGREAKARARRARGRANKVHTTICSQIAWMHSILLGIVAAENSSLGIR